MTGSVRHQDSLNSSGTISRKTSTASDYTPEHTVFPEGKIENEDEAREIGKDVSSTSVSTVSGDSTIRRDSLPEPDEREGFSEGLTYAEVTKSPRKEFVVRSDDDSVSVTSSQYTDTVTSLSDVSSGQSSSSDYRIGQKIELKICLLKQNDEKAADAAAVSPEKKPEAEAKLKVPQRKISRFLVSPVLEKLDLPKDKNFGSPTEDAAETAVPKAPVAQPEDEPMLTEVIVNQPEAETAAVQPEPAPEVPAAQPETVVHSEAAVVHPDPAAAHLDTQPEPAVQPDMPEAVAIPPERSELQLIPQESVDVEPESNKPDSEGPVCGPEMINTLEQLKISLQNITHAQLATTVAQPATPQPTLQSTPKIQPKPVGDPPNIPHPTEMLLTIDTQSTSTIPTPKTPVSRQMTHSVTEPGLSTVTQPYPEEPYPMDAPQLVAQASIDQPIQQLYVHQTADVPYQVPATDSSSDVQSEGSVGTVSESSLQQSTSDR